MKTFMMWLAIVVAVFANGCKQLEANEQQVAVTQHYPKFSWDTVPTFAHLGKTTADFTEAEAKYLANNFDLIVIEKTQLAALPEFSAEQGIYRAARQLKAINPDTKVMFYLNAYIDYDRHYEASKVFLAHPDWALKLKDGNFFKIRGSFTYDVTKPGMRNWWTDVCKKAMEQAPLDGVWADGISRFAMKPEIEYFGEEKYQKNIAGSEKMLLELREKLGTDKLIFGNGLFWRTDWWDDGGMSYVEYSDGTMAEHLAAWGGRDDEGKVKPEIMAKELELVQQALQMNKIVMVKGWPKDMVWNREKYDNLSQEEKLKFTREHITFPLAAFLIVAEPYCYFGYSWGWRIEHGWMEPYPQFSKRLGPPKGPAKRNGYIYTREFEYASVWLDIENEKAEINWR